MNYDFDSDDISISVSAVGEALIALDTEIINLEQQANLLLKQLGNITTKQRVCNAALNKLMRNAVNATIPIPHLYRGSYYDSN